MVFALGICQTCHSLSLVKWTLNRRISYCLHTWMLFLSTEIGSNGLVMWIWGVMTTAFCFHPTSPYFAITFKSAVLKPLNVGWNWTTINYEYSILFFAALTTVSVLVLVQMFTPSGWISIICCCLSIAAILIISLVAMWIYWLI